ncbi:MAG TPA: ABC transporter permease subunit [Mesorhizobium sp.]|nr:ABC transporter permease subunit [Mesorhizobium sp.]
MPTLANSVGNGRRLSGLLALLVIAALLGGAGAGLALEGFRSGGELAGFDAYLRRVTAFTLWQAALSTLVSVLPAILFARALHRHPNFFGRRFALALLAAPLALPAVVAALGVLALWGRAGLLAPVLASLGDGAWPGVYGLSGILLAHAFFNLPLAARFLLAALDTVPADQWRLARQLGLSPLQTFRLVEWPALRRALPGVGALVFMLCLTSFTIVLMLGGGPAATTLEVAIYQALRFDFDPLRAAQLTFLQVALAGGFALLLARLGVAAAGEAAPSVSRRQLGAIGPGETALNALILLLGLGFVAGPLLAVARAGLAADLLRLFWEDPVRQAAATSLVLAFVSAVLATILALALASGGARRGGRLGMRGTGAALVLAVPPVVIGAGWFLLLRPRSAAVLGPAFLVASVNALMALPFAARAVQPAWEAAASRHDRLCRSLGLRGWNRWRIVDWPVLRRPLLMALSFSAALSLGDLGAIALWGSDRFQTLPFLLLSRMGSYRTADAAGLALILGAACLALVLLSDQLGRRDAEA